MIGVEPCALNAEFQHFIPRFNKISLLYGSPLKEGFWGERRLKDRVTLQIILVFTLTHTPKHQEILFMNVYPKIS